MTHDAGLRLLRYKGCRLPHLMRTFRSHPICVSLFPLFSFFAASIFLCSLTSMKCNLRFSLVLYPSTGGH